MDDRELIARAIAGEDGLGVHHHEYLTTADAVLAVIGDRLMPELPDNVKRVGISTLDWSVSFYAPASPNDNGEIWQDVTEGDPSVAFAILSSVCEIPRVDEWSDWECYPEADGWIVFADNDGETGHPQGNGPTIAAAIRDALEDTR